MSKLACNLDTIGFIGQGAMGRPMALNLLKSGYSVKAFNPTRSKCRAAAEAGAVVADSISDVVEGSHAVIIMVRADRAVCDVVLGCDGLLAAGRPGLLVIDSTTIHPLTSQRIAAALCDKQIDYLDAPVMSDSEEARLGQLWFQVGGAEQAYLRAIPLFEAMGNKHQYLGPNGAGAGAKVGSFPTQWWKKRGYIDETDISFS